MLELGGVTLGLREAVIGLIALVAIYMLVVVLRMRRLRQPAAAQPSAPAADDAAGDTEMPLAGDDWAAPGLADGMLTSGLEQEVAMLRDEVDALRGELAALRADFQQELGHLRATQSVSPIYGDAMQMAAAGYDPATIAERCGIARAEAELVVALAKSQER